MFLFGLNASPLHARAGWRPRTEQAASRGRRLEASENLRQEANHFRGSLPHQPTSCPRLAPESDPRYGHEAFGAACAWGNWGLGAAEGIEREHEWGLSGAEEGGGIITSLVRDHPLPSPFAISVYVSPPSFSLLAPVPCLLRPRAHPPPSRLPRPHPRSPPARQHRPQRPGSAGCPTATPPGPSARRLCWMHAGEGGVREGGRGAGVRAVWFEGAEVSGLEGQRWSQTMTADWVGSRAAACVVCSL